MIPPVEMTKGRAALPTTVVAEQDPFFIALGGPKAHDSSGRDDKGEGGASGESSCWTDVFHPHRPVPLNCPFSRIIFQVANAKQQENHAQIEDP